MAITKYFHRLTASCTLPLSCLQSPKTPHKLGSCITSTQIFSTALVFPQHIYVSCKRVSRKEISKHQSEVPNLTYTRPSHSVWHTRVVLAPLFCPCRSTIVLVLYDMSAAVCCYSVEYIFQCLPLHNYEYHSDCKYTEKQFDEKMSLSLPWL